MCVIPFNPHYGHPDVWTDRRTNIPGCINKQIFGMKAKICFDRDFCFAFSSNPYCFLWLYAAGLPLLDAAVGVLTYFALFLIFMYFFVVVAVGPKQHKPFSPLTIVWTFFSASSN